MKKNSIDKETERRSYRSPLSVEQRGNGKQKITGYPAVFDRLSQDLGGFRERIVPGAFSEVLEYSDCRALYNHDPNFVLGRERSGTLHLEERTEGLWMEIDPPNTQAAKDLMESIRRGDISEQSFSFRVGRDRWEGLDNPDHDTIRTILEVSHLYDVGPVVYPAYQDTSVAIRSLQVAKNKKKRDPIFDEVDKTLARISWITDPFLSQVDKYIRQAAREGNSRSCVKYNDPLLYEVDRTLARITWIVDPFLNEVDQILRRIR